MIYLYFKLAKEKDLYRAGTCKRIWIANCNQRWKMKIWSKFARVIRCEDARRGKQSDARN